MVSNILRDAGTAIVFTDSGSGDIVLATNALGATSGQQSAVKDRGAFPLADLVDVHCKIQWTGAANTTDYIEVYLARSNDGTNFEGGATGANGSWTSTNTKGAMLYVGAVMRQNTAAATDNIQIFSDVPLPFRYFAVCVQNQAGGTLTATNGASKITVTPKIPQAQ